MPAQATYVPASLNSSGASFANLQANGVAGLLNLLIAANPAIANPASQATVNPSGGGTTGGLLPAGTYYASYIYRDGYGQTLIGSSRSAVFTQTVNYKPRVTFNDTPPAGADFRDVYLTAAGGTAGTEVLYASGIAAATATFDLLYAKPIYPATALEAIPTANTTGAATIKFLLDSFTNPNTAWVVYRKLRDLSDQFVSGDFPTDWYQVLFEVQRIDNTFATWRQLVADLMGLLIANPGSLHNASGNVMPITTRTFP